MSVKEDMLFNMEKRRLSCSQSGRLKYKHKHREQLDANLFVPNDNLQTSNSAVNQTQRNDADQHSATGSVRKKSLNSTWGKSHERKMSKDRHFGTAV